MMAHIGKVLNFSSMLETTRIHNYCFVITHIPILPKFTVLCNVPNQHNLRFIHMKRTLNAITVLQKDIKEENIDQDKLPEIVKYVNDKRIIYSSHIADQSVHLNYGTRNRLAKKFKVAKDRKIKAAATPLIIEKMLAVDEKTSDEFELESVSSASSTVAYPYSHTHDINLENITLKSHTEVAESELNDDNIAMTVREDIACRMLAYEEGILQKLESTSKKDSSKNTLTNFKDEYFFNDSISEDFVKDINTESSPLIKEHGTADPTIPVSDVPCGGCGAHLHCQAPAFPGFVPKEDFEGLNRGELRSVLCQRCYFLRYHKMALNVRVSPSVYPKILEPIKNVKALILVVVDLLDVPCSIWPNFIDIIGTRRPVVVVGNKVDLLPADGKNHLRRIEDSLAAAIDKTDLGRANIRHTVLVSAQTGFGIEDLITKIHNTWDTKGDIYILGCTNSGKSTLFNTLLGSDLCKTSASSLIQRATTSCWPGTTLNMLKFPILRPSRYRLYLRVQRMKEQQKVQSMTAKLKPDYTKSISVGTLSGHIGRTFENLEEPDERFDPFSTNMRNIGKEQRKILGINTNDPKYSLGKWCFDTPGTVQPDQLINLLTHDELMKVLPSRLIQPSTFCLHTGHSLFIGGLARLDLVYSPQPVRFTVFRSEHLPITVVKTVDASSFYRNYLGSTLLGVPVGDEERLRHWPAITPKNMRTFTISKDRSCADVVLSSAGWVAITGIWKHVIELRGWTPGGRGIYLRDPPILPLSIKLRGPRIEKSPAHKAHRIFVPK
ncbi:nitric oxide-associated protein 1-like isoform X1 [Procambarus clarkii]|uniref:nitric oxide-associated protein 1-like isoform X1 n=1 Tax=Procambarus clarkii TaxID=6728 RepID=UPI003743B5ED